MQEILAQYKIPLLLGAGSVILIAISLILLFKSSQSNSPIQFSENAATSGAVLGQSTIKVDVEGAVATPGLYSLSVGSRVEDAIAAAGGLTSTVDDVQFAKTINRAMKLVDGGKIFIPSLSDGPKAASAGQSSQASGIISVNTASESELDRLPGVGPVTAQKIIAGRPYQTIEELVTKKAIGQSLFEKIKSQLSL